MDLLGARDALKTAVVGAGVPYYPQNAADPSDGFMVFGEGATDLEHVVRAAVTARYRVVFYGGGWDNEAASDRVAVLLHLGIQAVRGAAGWRLDEVRRERVVQLAGASFLVAELIASRSIDL